MYYIYHIPGVKVGCTKNYPERPKSQSNIYELLETHTNINIANKREMELSIEYGYGWNPSHSYIRMTKLAKLTFENCSAGGASTYNSGKLKNIQKLSHTQTAPCNKKIKCPHCDKEGQKLAMKRWHFNNCKQKASTV